MEDRKPFSRNLRNSRKAAGFPRARHFAEAIGINENTYTRYERGESEPSLEALSTICKALSVSADALLGLDARFSQLAVSAGMSEDATDYEPHSGAIVSDDLELARVCWELAHALASIGATHGSSLGDSAGSLLERTSQLFARLEQDPYVTIARCVGGLPGSAPDVLAVLVERYLGLLRARSS